MVIDWSFNNKSITKLSSKTVFFYCFSTFLVIWCQQIFAQLALFPGWLSTWLNTILSSTRRKKIVNFAKVLSYLDQCMYSTRKRKTTKKKKKKKLWRSVCSSNSQFSHDFLTNISQFLLENSKLIYWEKWITHNFLTIFSHFYLTSY